MPSIAEAAVAGLGGTLVVTHLKIHLAFAGTKLFLREGPLVLIRHLRP